MPRRYPVTLMLLLTLVLVLGFAGCKKKTVTTQPAAPDREPVIDAPPPPPPTPERPTEDFPSEEPREQDVDLSADAFRQKLRTVYFALDSSDLTPESRQTLKNNADAIKDSGKWTVVIEGHCDERGSIEYNLALGQRRADAVRDYLSSLGVDASRVRVISYGEEHPAERGAGESVYSKNRRAEFEVE